VVVVASVAVVLVVEGVDVELVVEGAVVLVVVGGTTVVVVGWTVVLAGGSSRGGGGRDRARHGRGRRDHARRNDREGGGLAGGRGGQSATVRQLPGTTSSTPSATQRPAVLTKTSLPSCSSSGSPAIPDIGSTAPIGVMCGSVT
jgi:hypothetical protein